MSDYPRPKLGAPNAFTPARRKQILQYIRDEAPYELAALASGIGENCLTDWIARGVKDIEEENPTEYAQFVGELKLIALDNIRENTKSIKAQTKNWQARAWMLDRHPVYRKFFGSLSEERLNNLEVTQAKMTAELQAAKSKYEQPI